ncbi:MAG: hypothetical protein GXY51_02355 [Bacteroidetes bacterium]|nr:hypothetical protein [Bacteroidota bacterium]
MNQDTGRINLKKIDDRLKRIANVLLINASFIDNPGLLNGKTGISIFFYEYGRYLNNKIYTDYAGELIDEIYEEIAQNTPLSFSGGLTGIGWGIEYLVKNKFVDADTDEALADIDNAVYRGILNNPLLLESENDLFGYGHYCLSRLRGHENDDDNLTTLIKKEHLIYLIDECERLLVHKRYLEFNILQLSVASINSLLWFLLEVDRLGLFPVKVRKVLGYIPDYVSKEPSEYRADLLVLNELARRAVNQTSDTGLENQYLLLYESVSEELNRGEDGDGDEKILSDLQSLHLQRLVYGIDIHGDLLKDGSFEKAFSIIDDEENWNRTLEGINKQNLGLTGLAGTGLLLLNAISCPLPFAPSPLLPAPCPLPPAPCHDK